MVLPITLGGIAGLLLGWLAWLVAQGIVARYQAQAPPPQEAPTAAANAGAAPAVALVSMAAMALWGGYVGWRAPGLDVAVSALLVTALLLCLSLVDFQVRRIPNSLVLALLAMAAVQVVWPGRPAPAAAVLGALLAGGLFLLLRVVSRGTMGMGDVKLELALGALLGYPAVLPAMLAGILVGGLAALVLLLTKRVGRKDPIAYGPYLALGGWLLLVQAWGLGPM